MYLEGTCSSGENRKIISERIIAILLSPSSYSTELLGLHTLAQAGVM